MHSFGRSSSECRFHQEKILKLDYKASANRWEDIYELSRKYRLRNNIATYYTNMSLARLGLMPEKLMDFYQPAATGLFIPVNASENYLTITFSNEVYWQLGDVSGAAFRPAGNDLFPEGTQFETDEASG